MPNDDKKSFILFTENRKQIEQLSSEEAGILFKAILAYVDEGIIPQLDRTVAMCFSFMQCQLDRNIEKWNAVKEKRAQNGKKGGKSSGISRSRQNKANALKPKQNEANEANASNMKQNEANEANASNMKQNEANEAVNVNSNVNDNVNDNVNNNVNFNANKNKKRGTGPPVGGATASLNRHLIEPFNRFWESYPKRQAKQDAMKAFEKLEPDEDLLTVIIESVKRQESSDDWQKDNGRFIPMPATYLNGKRWEDEPTVVQNIFEPIHKNLNEVYMDAIMCMNHEQDSDER